MRTPQSLNSPIQSETYFPEPTAIPAFWTDSRENHVRLHVALPGCPRDQIQLRLEKDTLVVRARRKSPISEAPLLRTLLQESPLGSYQLKVRLPHRVKPEEVQTSRENGVLTITFPRESPEAQRIPVD